MKRLLCAILMLTILLSVSACSLFEPEFAIGSESAKLIVHFIDVGQGDCTLLESDDEFVLIDAGERDYGEEVLDYIEERGADELSYVIATHPHSDHAGGLRTVLDGIDAYRFITPKTDCETYTWTKLLRTVEDNDVNYIEAVPGDTYSFGEAEFTIMAPLSQYEDYNNCSVVTKVTCGDITFMLTGDAEKESESDMVDAGEDLSADVLKCGHHGSSTSSSAKFLKAVNPVCAVISCGKGNDYGHPHRETVRKLQALGCTAFRTDEDGTVVAYTDGKSLRFSTEKDGVSDFTYTAGDEKNSTDALNYIGNKSSHVFHYSDCIGAVTMSEKNRTEFTTRQEAVKAGYTPCSNCKP